MQRTNPWFNRNAGGQAQGLQASITTNAWPTANKAIAVPIIFPFAASVTAMSFRMSTAVGNYDMGLYLSTFAAVQRKGSTAGVNADLTLTFTTPLAVTAGQLFYAALVMANTGDSVVSQNVGAWVADAHIGCVEQASALPLPDPFVPALMSLAIVPVVKFTIAGLPT